MVLLQNDPVDGAPVLPLGEPTSRSIAVIGRLADAANLGDHGSSTVRAPSHVSPVDGIRAAFPDAAVTLVTDDDPTAAAEAARSRPTWPSSSPATRPPTRASTSARTR